MRGKERGLYLVPIVKYKSFNLDTALSFVLSNT